MASIRILVVDDSVVIRQMVSQILAEDPEFAVAGVAGDGKIALARIEQLSPDLVTLDVEMPVMNGLETLAEIRKRHPKLPVIMFSTLTERGAGATVEALSLGASDYVTKPSNTMSQDEARQRIRAELNPKIKALCRAPGASPPPLRAATPRITGSHLLEMPRTTHGTAKRSGKRKIEIVAIGTSTGGPNALGVVVPEFPKDFPVPVVIVQHMPPIFTRMLAERLASRSAIVVREGIQDAPLEPGVAWIAPGDYHMTVKRSPAGLLCLDLNRDAQVNSCRPAVDVLFRSVAETCTSNVLAVVMTGMGSDGVRGAERIRSGGGEVIVQDEKTSVVWGMPGFTFNEGYADAVYPLDQLQVEITRRVLASRGEGGVVDRRPAARVI
jgi:two-component system chemotaxis response regulator CheB